MFLGESKPKFYWVFAPARLADVAVRGVEMRGAPAATELRPFRWLFFEAQGVRSMTYLAPVTRGRLGTPTSLLLSSTVY